MVKVEISGAQPSHEVFIPSLPPEDFKGGADLLNLDGIIIIILSRNCSLTADSFSNKCLERIWAKLFDLSQSLSASEPA